MVVVYDLDDTLYNEIDFVKSGFLEISKYLDDDSYYDFMMKIFFKEGSGKVFNRLIDNFNLDIKLQKLIEIYRFHNPNIKLDSCILEVLNFTSEYKSALISDGHYIMQKNKFDALGLDKYINFPVFTDFYHTNKPNLKAYKIVMERFKEEDKFIYISDNPKKDFIAVKELGWIGIRYKNPNGIYKDYLNDTDYEIDNRSDIIKILKSIDK
jgi:putative hydrolase of the HAD superfamily